MFLAKIECRTNDHQLYNAVHSIRTVQDKRILNLREMLNRKEMNNIDLIDKTNQISDSLMKLNLFKAK